MTLGEITRREQREAMEKIKRMEQEERTGGVERRGNLIWVPTLKTGSGVRFGYWRKVSAYELRRL